MVAFVATALAADRVGAAAPILRPNNMAVAARQLAGRLAVGFRQVAAVVRYQPFRRNERPAASSTASRLPAIALLAHPCQFWLWQFRLPPPTV
jgi:hypothetical protein